MCLSFFNVFFFLRVAYDKPEQSYVDYLSKRFLAVSSIISSIGDGRFVHWWLRQSFEWKYVGHWLSLIKYIELYKIGIDFECIRYGAAQMEFNLTFIYSDCICTNKRLSCLCTLSFNRSHRIDSIKFKMHFAYERITFASKSIRLSRVDNFFLCSFCQQVVHLFSISNKPLIELRCSKYSAPIHSPSMLHNIVRKSLVTRFR